MNSTSAISEGDGQPHGPVVDLIESFYGSLDLWLHDFRLTGMALGGGSGWVIMSYDFHENAVHNYWAWDHTPSLAWGIPVLVMDMYEHSSHIDYGTDATGYINGADADVPRSVFARTESTEVVGTA